MSVSSEDSENYFSDLSSIHSFISSRNENARSDNKNMKVFNTPFENYSKSWFQTENSLSLSNYIKKLFSIVRSHLSCQVEPDSIKAFIVPHAGIKYSGLCAASAYYECINRTRPVKNIILLCTSHYNLVDSRNQKHNKNILNIMAPSFNLIKTTEPGKFLSIDTQLIDKIKHLIKLDNQENTHFLEEHSFFNQIPFLEAIAPDASICPLLINNIFIDSNNNDNRNGGSYNGGSYNGGSYNCGSYNGGGESSKDIFKNVKQILELLQKLIIILKTKYIRNDTILICSSDFSHINGNFEKKISSHIFQNIRKCDNETLQFIYNLVDGQESRISMLDTLLFMKNSSTCGIMAIYLFAKILNSMQMSFTSSCSSLTSSSSGVSDCLPSSNSNISKLKYPHKNKNKNQSQSQSQSQRFNSRISCYYTSITREFINLEHFDNKNLVPLYEIKSSNTPSVSYLGLIYTKQQDMKEKYKSKLEFLLTQYEEYALLGLAREQLFYYLLKKEGNVSLPSQLIKPINAQVFQLELGVFTTIKNNGILRGCIGTLETDNDELNIEKNVKQFVIEASSKDSRFKPITLSEFNKVDISITLLNKLIPITLNQYFTNKFQLGKNGILMKIGKQQGYFLPSVASELGLKTNEKNKLLDELCQEKVAKCDTKKAFRKYSNTQLFYNEGLEITFTH